MFAVVEPDPFPLKIKGVSFRALAVTSGRCLPAQVPAPEPRLPELPLRSLRRAVPPSGCRARTAPAAAWERARAGGMAGGGWESCSIFALQNQTKHFSRQEGAYGTQGQLAVRKQLL